MLSRRRFLQSTSSAALLAPLLPASRAQAEATTAIIIAALAVGSKVLSILGSKHAKRAKAYEKAAQKELLLGIAKAVDSLLQTSAVILQEVQNLPSVIREIFEEVQFKNGRGSVMRAVQRHNNEKLNILERIELARDPIIVQRYFEDCRRDFQIVEDAVYYFKNMEREPNVVFALGAAVGCMLEIGTEIDAMQTDFELNGPLLDDLVEWCDAYLDESTKRIKAAEKKITDYEIKTYTKPVAASLRGEPNSLPFVIKKQKRTGVGKELVDEECRNLREGELCPHFAGHTTRWFVEAKSQRDVMSAFVTMPFPISEEIPNGKTVHTCQRVENDRKAEERWLKDCHVGHGHLINQEFSSDDRKELYLSLSVEMTAVECARAIRDACSEMRALLLTDRVFI